MIFLIKNFVTLFFLFFFTTCSRTQQIAGCSKADQNIYRYDPTNGKCLNCLKKEGTNTFDIAKIRQSKDASCVQFPKMHLVELLEGIHVSNEFSYHTLENFNFRGAILKNVTLHFNSIKNADFSGANLNGFEFGYAEITGKTDRFTILPKEACTVQENQLSCVR